MLYTNTYSSDITITHERLALCPFYSLGSDSAYCGYRRVQAGSLLPYPCIVADGTHECIVSGHYVDSSIRHVNTGKSDD